MRVPSQVKFWKTNMKRLAISSAGIFLAITLIVPQIVAEQEKIAKNATQRTWTDASGNFSVKAKLLKLADGQVHLEKIDGSTTAVRLAKLSEKDQEFVSQFFSTQGKRDAAAAQGPWKIMSYEEANSVRNSDGTFTIGGEYLIVVIECRTPQKKDAGTRFELRKGKDGEFVGRRNNSVVKRSTITLLFEGVSAKPKELYLADDKGNQHPLVK